MKRYHGNVYIINIVLALFNLGGVPYNRRNTQSRMFSARVWNSRQIVQKMLSARGYSSMRMLTVKTVHELNASEAYTYENIGIIGMNGNFKVKVIFSPPSKIGVKPIRSYMDSAIKDDIFHVILVHQSSITNPAKREIRNITRIKFETFHVNELQFDITTHELNPKVRLLSHLDRERLVDLYGWSITSLPRFVSTDPLVRFHGYEPGDVIEITGTTPEGGYGTTYRVVVQVLSK